jgi:hypothetical protein
MINKLVYGNPSYESYQRVIKSNLLREMLRNNTLSSVLHIPYPSDDKTIVEVVQLISMTPDSHRMEKVVEYENDLYGAMSRFLESYGIEESKEQIKHILSIYEPIEDFLKIRYNRPRPHQFAAYFDLPLYPKLKTDASSASYPSGHTLDVMWFRHHYIKLYPQLKSDLMDFVLDVKKTREEGGVHYPSDGTFSILIYHRLKNYFR